MAEKKNPLVGIAISAIPQLFGMISSAVKDKREKKKAEAAGLETDGKTDTAPGAPQTGGEVIIGSLKDAVSGSISSKRLLNLGGTAVIIGIAMTDIAAKGITKMNLCLIGLGIVYSLGMSVITYLSDRTSTK